MLLLGGSVPDDADGLHRHRLLNGLAIGMPPDHGLAMLWAPYQASNPRVPHVCVTPVSQHHTTTFARHSGWDGSAKTRRKRWFGDLAIVDALLNAWIRFALPLQRALRRLPLVAIRAPEHEQADR